MNHRMDNRCLTVDLARFVGRTVTIFTASGGLSGSGFTGILACVDDCTVKLITRVGAAPACPLGSACTGFDDFGGGPWGGGWGGSWGGGCGGRFGHGGGWGNILGSVTEIPLGAIVSFTHSAI
ncbi:MAG: hypothetical protein LBE35_04205 [Clostridiales bacterium]|jgi:hypothetical protein|nr:hypothetical protein [Clostridiales bacterium]